MLTVSVFFGKESDDKTTKNRTQRHRDTRMEDNTPKNFWIFADRGRPPETANREDAKSTEEVIVYGY
jgi:hypothetical protein